MFDIVLFRIVCDFFDAFDIVLFRWLNDMHEPPIRVKLFVKNVAKEITRKKEHIVREVCRNPPPEYDPPPLYQER